MTPVAIVEEREKERERTNRAGEIKTVTNALTKYFVVL